MNQPTGSSSPSSYQLRAELEAMVLGDAFARKQDMWFRRLPNVHQINAAAPDVLGHARAAIEAN